jgi:hypothetical protein
MYCALGNPIAPFERGRTADAGKLDHQEHQSRDINEGRSDQALCELTLDWMERLRTKPFPRTPGGALFSPWKESQCGIIIVDQLSRDYTKPENRV